MQKGAANHHDSSLPSWCSGPRATISGVLYFLLSRLLTPLPQACRCPFLSFSIDVPGQTAWKWWLTSVHTPSILGALFLQVVTCCHFPHCSLASPIPASYNSYPSNLPVPWCDAPWILVLPTFASFSGQTPAYIWCRWSAPDPLGGTWTCHSPCHAGHNSWLHLHLYLFCSLESTYTVRRKKRCGQGGKNHTARTCIPSTSTWTLAQAHTTHTHTHSTARLSCSEWACLAPVYGNIVQSP